MGNSPSRRNYLKGTIGTIMLGGVAGCSGDGNTGGGNGGGNGGGKVTPEEGSMSEYEPVGESVYINLSRESVPLRNEAGKMMVDYMEELGLQMEITTLDMGTAIASQPPDEGEDYDWIMMVGGANPSRVDPTTFLLAPYTTEGGINYTNYSNPAYDEAAKTFSQNLDKEERKQGADVCQQILSKDLPHLFLWHMNSLSGANANQFSNWNAVPGSMPFWSIDSLRQLNSNGNTNQVIWAATSTPQTIHPMAGNAPANPQAKKMIYGRLSYVTTDGEFAPRDAETLEVVDNTTVEATLREGITFHDGEPVTAEDVKFTVDYLQKHGFPDRKVHYSPIDNVEIVDERTARFNLKNPTGQFPSINLANLNILPKHIWDGVVEEKGLNHPREWNDFDMTGSGPFKVEEFASGNRMVLSVHDGYPMEFDFDRLIWDTYGSQSAAMGDVENGNATFIQNISPTNYQLAESSSAVKAVSRPSHGFTYPYPNLTKEPWNDIVMRRAVSHAVDKRNILNVAAQNLGDVAKDCIAPSLEFWNYTGDQMTYRGGVEKGIELLKQAGYRWDENGNLLKPKSRFSGEGPPEIYQDLE